MKKTIFSALIIAAPLGITTAKAADTKVGEAIQEAQKMFYDAVNKDTTSVSFDAGSSTLGESERRNLAALVQAVKSDTQIRQVVVAAWSDKEYPAAKSSDLHNADRELAAARLKAIRMALHDLGLNKIETHSMAEHPSWIAKTFNTVDSKVKGEGQIKDLRDKKIAEVGKVLRDKGGPGKAVVVLQRTVETAVN